MMLEPQAILSRVLRWITPLTLLTALPTLAADLSRPGEGSGPTEVRVTLVIVNVSAIDDVGQSFSANVYLEGRWKDSRLAHEGPSKVSRPLDQIWHPRTQIVNRLRVFSTMPEIVEIDPEGEVVYRQRVVGSFSQRLRLQDFPFDSQECELRLVPTGYSPQEVEFVILKSGLASEHSISGWSLQQAEAAVLPFLLMPGGSPIPSVILKFEAVRDRGYYILKIILPLILIVAMSWIAFWIDPEQAGPQVSVAVTTMLTLIAFRFMVGALLPRLSYLTRLDLLILASTVLVFATIVEAVVTATLAGKGRIETARAIDRQARWVFPAAFLGACVVSFAV